MAADRGGLRLSGVDIRAATAADADAVAALLNARMNRRIDEARWRALFEVSWRPSGTSFGTVAVARDGRLVGFCGALPADRIVAGRRERLVNICAWYLSVEARGSGIGTGLMAAATADTSASYTIMTSSAFTRSILDRVGYRTLDTAKAVWRPQDGPHDLGLIPLDEGFGPPVTDHPPPRTYFYRLEAKDSPPVTIAVAPSRKGEHVLWLDILHASDGAALAALAARAARPLLERHGGDGCLAADLRFLGGHMPTGAEIVTLPVPRFVKTARHLPDAAFDHLYTELGVLGLKLD